MGNEGRVCGSCVFCDPYGPGKFLCCMSHQLVEHTRDASICGSWRAKQPTCVECLHMCWHDERAFCHERGENVGGYEARECSDFRRKS